MKTTEENKISYYTCKNHDVKYIEINEKDKKYFYGYIYFKNGYKVSNSWFYNEDGNLMAINRTNPLICGNAVALGKTKHYNNEIKHKEYNFISDDPEIFDFNLKNEINRKEKEKLDIIYKKKEKTSIKLYIQTEE